MKKQGSIEFTLVERSADRVVSEMPIQPGVRNPFGVVQAGAILWFADVSATILAMGGSNQPSCEGMAGFPLAINLNAKFAGNQKKGALRAESTFLKRGRSVSIVRTVVCGDAGRLIADITSNHVLSK